ncbi:MAG TPA: hypothetical protein VFI92_05865 [Steroidobacteraceae bacterium]|nr:hypothetical protein [Steroidobacteraceae bacterium]
MDGSKFESIQPSEAAAQSLMARCELAGQAAVAAWLEALCASYADDVRWTAPRRGLAIAGRGPLTACLARELAAMADPRVCVLRRCDGQARSFHEFTIHFHLAAPGIEGVSLPLGTEVELERLRVLTHDAAGRVAVESCIETWTTLAAGRTDR